MNETPMPPCNHCSHFYDWPQGDRVSSQSGSGTLGVCCGCGAEQSDERQSDEEGWYWVRYPK
jgi:hypothetical protein